MGWLTDLTKWLGDQIKALWDAIEAFFNDLLVTAVEVCTQVALTIIEALPNPEFLTTYSLCNLLNMAGPDVGFFLQTFRIGEGLGVLALGYVFRLTRKLFTLGQW